MSIAGSQASKAWSLQQVQSPQLRKLILQGRDKVEWKRGMPRGAPHHAVKNIENISTQGRDFGMAGLSVAKLQRQVS